MKVTVKPKSNKAKNRLANVMGNDPVCIVQQDEENALFLASENQKYFFWVDKLNDPNWEVSNDELLHKTEDHD